MADLRPLPTGTPAAQAAPGGILLEQGRGRVTVRSGGLLLADSRRPVVVLEGHHPVRYYLPPEDVHRGLLVPSWESTYCPYKGAAVHYALAPDGGEAVAWSYPEPLPGMEALAGLIAFYQERVQLAVEPSD
ncbi:DUF427 domain-containing protein [Kitasatospora sp. NPDC004272]